MRSSHLQALAVPSGSVTMRRGVSDVCFFFGGQRGLKALGSARRPPPWEHDGSMLCVACGPSGTLVKDTWSVLHDVHPWQVVDF